jgi:hypothetical protein
MQPLWLPDVRESLLYVNFRFGSEAAISSTDELMTSLEW